MKDICLAEFTLNALASLRACPEQRERTGRATGLGMTWLLQHTSTGLTTLPAVAPDFLNRPPHEYANHLPPILRSIRRRSEGLARADRLMGYLLDQLGVVRAAQQKPCRAYQSGR